MSIFHKFLKRFLLLLAVLLVACAAQQPVGPRLVDHAFSFDARVDSKDTEILAFKYGMGGTPQTQAPFWKDEKNARQGTNINGVMPLGDTLYVKWRNQSSNEIFEDLVNLKPLLPSDMSRQRIHFVVQGAQLFVYQIEPVPRPPDWPIIGPRKFQYEKVNQIYPATNK
jgi:hypothetical protein